MTANDSGDARDEIRRWLEDGPERLAFLLDVLREVDRLRERLELAEAEQERLRRVASDREQLEARLATSEFECARLRDEVARLRAEHEQCGQERLAVAEQISDVMNQVLLRLRSAG